jgi:uncharacterized protein YndB with AHSA1/START domain
VPKLTHEITIARTPEDVWAVLGDLRRPDAWVPGIARVRMDGATRVCELADGGEIHEELAAVPERRAFSYVQTRHPLPLAVSQGTLAVEPEGAGARVVWEAEVGFADRALEEQLLPLLDRGYAAALESLRAVLER